MTTGNTLLTFWISAVALLFLVFALMAVMQVRERDHQLYQLNRLWLLMCDQNGTDAATCSAQWYKALEGKL